jgi:hypothetical protein
MRSTPYQRISKKNKNKSPKIAGETPLQYIWQVQMGQVDVAHMVIEDCTDLTTQNRAEESQENVQ